jgi:hypothetical protein
MKRINKVANYKTIDALKAMMNDKNASENERAIARAKYLEYSNQLVVTDNAQSMNWIERGRKRAQERTATVVAEEQEKRRNIQRASEARDLEAIKHRQDHEEHLARTKKRHDTTMLFLQDDYEEALEMLKRNRKRREAGE